MNNPFRSPIAEELNDFLRFKRSLGYGYMRGEFALREFDRFLVKYAAANRRWELDQVAIEWLSSKPGRKPVSVSGDAAVLRQFYRCGHDCLPSPPLFPVFFPRKTFSIC